MDQHDEAALTDYPHGRGYGHDYMRGGEIFGGYGYADREEFAKPRGELLETEPRLVEEETDESGASSPDRPRQET